MNMKKTLCLMAALLLCLFAAAAYADNIGTVTVIAKGKVNVRTGGGTEYPIVGQALPGQTFPVIGCADTLWYHIRLSSGQTGYISQKMVSFSPAATAQNSNVTVYYRTLGGEVLATNDLFLPRGQQTVYANSAYVPQGYALISPPSVQIMVDDRLIASPAAVLFIYDSQNVGAQAAAGATVTVTYKDIYGSTLTQTAHTLPEGSHTLRANSALLPQGYVIVGEKTAGITVSGGQAAPREVTFICAVNTAVPAATVPLTVHYRRTDGTWLYSETLQLTPGTHVIYAMDQRVPAGYTLYSSNSVTVHVDGKGNATPSAVVFQYQKNTQKQSATVPVTYRLTDGRTLAINNITLPEGSHLVTADSAIIGGYALQSPLSVPVYVNQNGQASPKSVLFMLSGNLSKAVPVRYMDDRGRLLFETAVTIAEGTHSIFANTALVPGGYALISPDSQQVTLSGDGALTPRTVTFLFQKQQPQQPAPTPAVSGGSGQIPMYQKASIQGEYAVYSGPGAWYDRAGGNAAVKMGVCRFYGVENGYALMGYQYDTGKYRLGYIEQAGVPDGITLAPLSLMYEPVTVLSDAAITDDPVIKPAWLRRIPQGTQVTLLGFLPDNDHWAYIETDYGGPVMRGFINRVRIGR